MLELCAGSAMLSRCFHEQGFTVMPVDHQQNRFHPLAKICNMSLTLDSSWKYLFWLVSTFTVLFCHAAPPCGTCSRARELPGGPPPLRNEVYPWGFDDLSSDQRARVDAANKIYIGLAKFVEFLILQNVFFAIENPENSLLWLLPIWTTVFQHAFLSRLMHAFMGGNVRPPKPFLQMFPNCGLWHKNVMVVILICLLDDKKYLQENMLMPPQKRLHIQDHFVFKLFLKFVLPYTLICLQFQSHQYLRRLSQAL